MHRPHALATLVALLAPLITACADADPAAAADAAEAEGDAGAPEDPEDADDGGDDGGTPEEPNESDDDDAVEAPACEWAARTLALDEISEVGVSAAEILARAAGQHAGVLRYDGGGEVDLLLEVAYAGGPIAIHHVVGGCPSQAKVTIAVLAGIFTADGALKESGVPAYLEFRLDDPPEGVLVDLQPIDLGLLHGDLTPPEVIAGIGAAEFSVITVDAEIFIGPPRALPGPAGAVIEGVHGVVTGTGELDAWSCPAGEEASCPGSNRGFMVGTVLLDL